MKPLSERIKEFPNNQFVEWLCLACVDVREVRTPDDAQEEINKIRDAVTGRLASLAQRAEAAEAKLAELEQQEPVAYVHPAYLQAGALGFDASVGRLAPAQIPLFTRPAPAADLAELVPDEMTWNQAHSLLDINQCGEDRFSAFMMGANYNRATILLKIEEAK